MHCIMHFVSKTPSDMDLRNKDMKKEGWREGGKKKGAGKQIWKNMAIWLTRRPLHYLQNSSAAVKLKTKQLNCDFDVP